MAQSVTQNWNERNLFAKINTKIAWILNAPFSQLGKKQGGGGGGGYNTHLPKFHECIAWHIKVQNMHFLASFTAASWIFPGVECFFIHWLPWILPFYLASNLHALARQSSLPGARFKDATLPLDKPIHLSKPSWDGSYVRWQEGMKNTTNVFSHVHLRSWYLIKWSTQSGIQWIQKKEPSMDLPQKQECLQQPIKATTCTSTPKSKLPNGNAIQLRRSIPSNSHNPSQLYKALASRASSFSPRVMTTHHSN